MLSLSRDDTWEYDPHATSPWRQVFSTAVPPARHAHRLAFDPLHERVVLFGGADANAQFRGDTWTLRSGPSGSRQWVQHTPAQSPPGRWHPAMAYDPRRNVVVMTGGYGDPRCGSLCASYLDDHWEFDSASWRQRVQGSPTAQPDGIATPMPAAREGASMVFDDARQRFLLFGGSTNASGMRNDPWQFRAVVDRDGRGQAGSIALRRTRAPYAAQDVAFEFDNASSFGWLAVHLETQPVPTHFVDPPLACGSRASFYGLNPIVASIGGNPGRIRFGLPAWTLGYGLAFQAIALDAPNVCLRVSDPLTAVVQ